MIEIEATLERLRAEGNFRSIPADTPAGMVDLSGNDYLGLGADLALREEFFALYPPQRLAMTSSASRLLAGMQSPYNDFEAALSEAYGYNRQALVFNSGYHANVGLVSALASKGTLIVADRLVHASIIDGIKLSGAEFVRFPHNDLERLEAIIKRKAQSYASVLIVAESVYSMDGDSADIQALVKAKRLHSGAMLYVDEAHAVGVCGPAGLGMVQESGLAQEVDVVIGTLGKALASMGAFAIISPQVREFLINKARPFIFSTALPPSQLLWSKFVWEKALEADTRRAALNEASRTLAGIIHGGAPSHIRPLIIGSSEGALRMSAHLADNGFKVLPIRTPTVPPGTERLRFSLSADLTPEMLLPLKALLKNEI